VGQLDHLGLIDHDRKRPSAVSRGFQSRLRASEMLMQFATERHPILRCSPRSPLILRDEDGHQIRFRDTAWTRAVVRNVAVIEEMLSSTRIDLDDATPCLWRSGNFMELSDHKHHPYSIHLAHVPITRIFNNGTFEHGGRFVGPPYQSWPKGIRPYITLDGEPTEELDYGQTHVRMLCAQAGLDIKANDVFKIPGGFDREIVKTMFYILINATSLDSALLAMQDEKPRYKGKRAQAIAITEAIKEQFPALVPYLHTGAGLWLMRHESDIAEDVLLNLTARGIAAMPIHDSFVVEAKNAPVLEQIMRDSWSKFVASEATVKYKPKPSVFSPLQQNVPTSVVVGGGGCGVPPGGLAVIVDETLQPNSHSVARHSIEMREVVVRFSRGKRVQRSARLRRQLRGKEVSLWRVHDNLAPALR